MQKTPSVERFLPLKPRFFHILLSLAGQDQHGYGIMQDILERTNGKVRLWPAALYGTLKQLVEHDLIVETDKRPAGEADDPRRRYYRLTPMGRRVLAAESRRLEELVHMSRSRGALAPRKAEM